MRHKVVRLAGKIDCDFMGGEIVPLYSDKGRPGIQTRFVIGLSLLKHIYGLSDEGACDRWVYDPYFQHFTGEEFFQHEFPHERSDLSHWRKRLGNKLVLLLAESLRVAHESGALRTKDLARVTVDTTVQPKNITFPTDAKLLHAAIKGLTRLARKHGVRLRQSYLRIAKRAAMMAGVMPTPNSSIATADSCAFCAPGSAGSFATSVVRSQATRTSRRHSCGHSRAPIRSARSSSASAAGSCIPSTLRRWSASARARPARLMSSV